MPNIKQQQKRPRVRQAAAREPPVPLDDQDATRRLETAVEEGDAATVDDERRRLEHWLDLAAVRGAIHKNKAARRKSQVAPRGRDRAGGGEHAQARPPPPLLAGLAARLGARDRYQRALARGRRTAGCRP